MSKDKTSIKQSNLRSSGPDFDRFMKSTIWYDMQQLVKERVEYLQEQMLATDDTKKILNIRSQMIAWKEMLGLPTYLKQCAHGEQHAKQQEINYGDK